jgi:uncharacterized protein (TIGR03083 family)
VSDRLWEPAAYTTAAVAEITRMAEAVRGADPETRVPTCPDWSVAELVEHTGTVHRWATQMVRDRAPKRLDPRTLDLALPDDAVGYADWLSAGAEPLASVFGAADPDAPMWAWGADQHARFWFRRMLHETTVHRADVEIATGRRPQITPEVAADAVDELLDNLRTASYFRPRVEELRGGGETIALRARDSGNAWVIRLAADGYHWERAGSGNTLAGTVAVTARVEALTLLLYSRAALHDDGYDVVGDEKVLARWLECSAL